MAIKMTPEKVREALIMLSMEEGVDTRHWILENFDSEFNTTVYRFKNIDTGEVLIFPKRVTGITTDPADKAGRNQEKDK